jgi:membrane protein
MSINNLIGDGLKEKTSAIIDDVDRHEVFILAGSLAFTTALALAPFIVILLGIVAVFGRDSQAKLIDQLTRLLGEQSGGAIQLVITNANKNSNFIGISGIISFVVLAISASAIFSQLRTALDKMNERKKDDTNSGVWFFFKEKFLSVGLVIGFIFLLITSLFISTAISVVFSGHGGWLWQTVNLVVSFCLFSVLFTLMYRFIPSEKVPWRRCGISGLMSAGFYLVGKVLIGIYLGRSALASAYGAAGSLVVFLAWVYYTTLTMLVSYEFTKTVVLSSDGNKSYLPREAR